MRELCFVPEVGRALLAVASAEDSVIVANSALPPARKHPQEGRCIRKSVRVARGKGYQKWPQEIFLAAACASSRSGILANDVRGFFRDHHDQYIRISRDDLRHHRRIRDARAVFAMFCSLILLIAAGGGAWSFGAKRGMLN